MATNNSCTFHFTVFILTMIPWIVDMSNDKDVNQHSSCFFASLAAIYSLKNIAAVDNYLNQYAYRYTKINWKSIEN